MKNKKWIAFVMLTAALIVINFLAKFIPLQLDLTSGKLYTLSKGSRQMLSEIEEPITLQFYFSRSTEKIPVFFKNYALRVENFLNQYVRASRGKIALKIIDPKPDTLEEANAIRSGVLTIPLPSGDRLFFGLVAIREEQEQTLPLFNLQRERLLEFDISRLIYRVQQTTLPKIGILSALPVTGGFSAPSPDAPLVPQQPWVFIQELSSHFEIETIREETLLEDLDLIAIIHPQGLNKTQLYAIDQYLLSGKPLFIAIDPSSRFQSEREFRLTPGTPNPISSNLPELFQAWGIRYDPLSFVADRRYAASVNWGQDPVPKRFPAWLSIDDVNQDHPIMAQLSQFLLPEVGVFSISIYEESNLSLTPFIESSTDSNLMLVNKLFTATPEDLMHDISSEGEKYTIGGLIEGFFTTAFPEGAPEKDNESKNENKSDVEETKTTASEHLNESISKSRIILFADTDFLADAYTVQTFDFFGFRSFQPLNDNLSLVSNSIDFLTGSQYLISIRSKGVSLRPFKRIRDLEAKAQVKYQEQLLTLEERLKKVQGKLSQLQTEQREQGQLVLSPEVSKALETFRNEEAVLRSERREIRKKLREDREKLNFSLALINLLPVPVLSLSMGIYYLYRRNQKAKK